MKNFRAWVWLAICEKYDVLAGKREQAQRTAPV